MTILSIQKHRSLAVSVSPSW